MSKEEKRNMKFYISDNFCINIDDISSIEQLKNPPNPDYPFDINFISKSSGWGINNTFRNSLVKFIEENDGEE